MEPTHHTPPVSETNSQPQAPTPDAPPANKPPRPSAPAPKSPADLVAAMTDGEQDSVERELNTMMGGMTAEEMAAAADAAPKVQEPEEAQLIKGRVANIGSQDVLIDFDGKSLGSMPHAEFGRDEKYAVGDPIEVSVVGKDERLGLLIVSRKKARELQALATMQPGTIVSGVVSGMNKGGLEVDIEGLRGFIPASQVDVHFLKDISALLGQTIRAEVTKFEADEQNIVLSRRKVLLVEAEQEKHKVFGELVLGQIRKGTVKSLTDYGAFIDLGGVDGLLHVSDMSWGRINKPEEVVKVGDEVEVKVIKLQRDKEKVSLSLKEVKPNPWTNVADRYIPGAKVNGRVVRMQNFGAFVELEPGVEALLPISELSWTRRVRHPSEIVKDGDVVEVSILSVDQGKQRISLSLKAVKDDPWASVAERFPAGAKIKGKVARTADFGAFVELEEGIDGLIHISELADTHVKAVTDKVKPGDEVDVRVLAVDTVNKKISLSMKTPPREPTPEELAEIAARRAAAEKEQAKKRAKQASRRGGITIEWDQGLGSLDPSKFARS
ncbi:MAG: S1 RNA-binding domain-containing protein [Planctomycetes bacterium]|nr:S1 RNA-binding domain-containing protein [Planctomycetota bacterium]